MALARVRKQMRAYVRVRSVLAIAQKRNDGGGDTARCLNLLKQPQELKLKKIIGLAMACLLISSTSFAQSLQPGGGGGGASAGAAVGGAAGGLSIGTLAAIALGIAALAAIASDNDNSTGTPGTTGTTGTR